MQDVILHPTPLEALDSRPNIAFDHTLRQVVLGDLPVTWYSPALDTHGLTTQNAFALLSIAQDSAPGADTFLSAALEGSFGSGFVPVSQSVVGPYNGPGDYPVPLLWHSACLANAVRLAIRFEGGEIGAKTLTNVRIWGVLVAGYRF